jgi:WRKY transcription factor 2
MEQDNNNINNNNNNENKNGGAFLKFSPKRSIAERRGFNKNTAMINTKRFRFSGFGATNSLVSSAAQSPCFTIPSGISPTSLLDSPIMLPNSQVCLSILHISFSFFQFHN